MRTTLSFGHNLLVFSALAMVLALVPACKPKAPPSGPPPASLAKTNAPVSATNRLSAEYISTFEELMPPKGTDPFFPTSHRRDPIPILISSPDKAPTPMAEVVLKGIVGAANHRLAVINNAILEAGETGTIHVSTGKVRVKCLEIGEDSAVVQIEGELQPKRLELNKKGR